VIGAESRVEAHIGEQEGVPFTFSLFTALGEFASIQALQTGEAWIPAGSARGFTNTRPSPNSVLTFP
jgi:hypothetical protein